MIVSCNDVETEFTQHIIKGDEYFAKNEFQQAISEFHSAVNLKPNSADAHFKLGKAYKSFGGIDTTLNLLQFPREQSNFFIEEFISELKEKNDNKFKSKQLENSIMELKTAIEIDNKSFEAYKLLGDLYGNQNPQIAENYYLEAIKNKPDNPEVYSKLADLIMRSDPKRSEYYYKLSIKLKPDSIESYRKLNTYYILNRSNSKGIDLCKKLISDYPKIAEAHVLLGFAFNRIHNISEAVKEYKQAISIDPKNVEARSYLGKIYLNKYDYSNAIIEFKKIIEINPKSIEIFTAREFLFDIYSKTKEYDKLIPLANDIIKSAPCRYNCMLLGDAYYLNNEYKNAIKAYKEATRNDYKNTKAYIGLAKAYFKNGNFDQASSILEKCKAKGKSDKEVMDLSKEICKAKLQSESKH